MRTSLVTVPVLLFALAGCGGTDSASSGASSTPPAAAASPASAAPSSAAVAPPTPSAAPAPAMTPPAPAPAPSSAAAAAGLADKSFTAEPPVGVKDSFGTCSGIGRVTNTASEEKTAVVTYTVLKGGATVATPQGAAQGVAPGKTVSVQLISTGACGSGPFTYEFQVDTEF